MGGEANWVKVKDWAQAKEKVDPSYAKKVSEYRKMIDTGGFSAESAGKALKADYEADPKNGGLGQAAITRGQTVIDTSAGAPLSREDYNKELHKAHRRNAPDADLQALHNRRRAGMQAERGR